MTDILKRIEDLRDELHSAIEEGNQDNILHKSKVLNTEILRFIKVNKTEGEGLIWKATNW